MPAPRVINKRSHSWAEFNETLADACRLGRYALAALDAVSTSVLLTSGPGAPILAQVWPILSDDPACAADPHLARAAERTDASRITVWPAGGLLLIVEPLTADSPEERSTGRPPFGFRPGPCGWQPDPAEAAIVRMIYQSEDEGVADMAAIGRLVLRAHPWLAERGTWRPNNVQRTVGRILARRAELEPLLVGISNRKANA
jgi:hypothetical protein